MRSAVHDHRLRSAAGGLTKTIQASCVGWILEKSKSLSAGGWTASAGHQEAIETYRSVPEVARRLSAGWEMEMSRSLLLQGTADSWLDVIQPSAAETRPFQYFQAADAWLDVIQPSAAETRPFQYFQAADAWLDVIQPSAAETRPFQYFQAADAWLDVVQPPTAETRTSQYDTPV